MNPPLTERAPAKINLTLRVVGRRADGYHELESLVAFAGIADTLTLQPGEHTALDIDGPFGPACGTAGDNLVLKAAAALREALGTPKGGHFRLTKNLPVAAGIGGGSADAAATLRLMARASGLPADHPALAAAALATGADVPVCLASKARVMRGVGEILSPTISMEPLPALLVNPGVALSTRDVFVAFAGMTGGSEPLPEVPETREAMFDFLIGHGNDLTAPAVHCAPVIGEVLDTLARLPGVRLARMSGSGPTCFALFTSTEQAEHAAGQLSGAYPNWWVQATQLG